MVLAQRNHLPSLWHLLLSCLHSTHLHHNNTYVCTHTLTHTDCQHTREHTVIGSRGKLSPRLSLGRVTHTINVSELEEPWEILLSTLSLCIGYELRSREGNDLPMFCLLTLISSEPIVTVKTEILRPLTGAILRKAK